MDEFESQRQRLRLLESIKRYEDGLRLAEQVLSTNPQQIIAMLWRSRFLCHLRRYDEALDAAERALSIAPANPRAFSMKADALSSLGRTEEALSAVDESIRLDPTNPWTLRYRCRLLLWVGRQEEAREALDAVHRVDPTSIETRALTTELARLLDSADAAEAIAEGLIAEAPTNPDAIIQMAGLASASGRLDEARSIAASGLRIHPQDGRLRFVYSITLVDCARDARRRGNAEEARTLMAQAESVSASLKGSARARLALHMASDLRNMLELESAHRQTARAADTVRVRVQVTPSLEHELDFAWAALDRYWIDATSAARRLSAMEPAARRFRGPAPLAGFLMVLGAARVRCGDPDGATGPLEEAVALSQSDRQRVWAILNLVECRLASAQVNEAAALARDVQALAVALEQTAPLAVATVFLALVEGLTGDTEEGDERLLRGTTLVAECQDVAILLDVISIGAEAALRLGDQDVARRLALTAIRELRKLGAPAETIRAMEVARDLARLEGRDQIAALWARAVARQQGIGPHEHISRT